MTTNRANFGNASATDIEWGEGTFTQGRRLGTDGVISSVTRNKVNAGHVPLTAATIATLGLSAGADVEDALVVVAPTAVATTTTQGKVKVDHNGSGDPVALTTTGTLAGLIPTSGQNDALDGATSPSATNVFITSADLADRPDYLGTGKDGQFKVGTITDPGSSTATALSGSTSSGAVPAGTYTYRVVFGNITGGTDRSNSSASVTLGSTGTITGTIPTGGANTAWRRLYRDDGSSSWRLVMHIPNNTDTTFTDTMPFGGAVAPTSNTTNASWGSPQGEWHFTGDMTISAALTTSTTTINAGVLKIRCRGTVTVSAAISANGAGQSLASALPFNSRATNPAGSHAVTATVGTGGKGSGIIYRLLGYPGKGSDGTQPSGTAGVGGSPAGTVAIYAHRIIVDANITANGTNGTAASGASAGGGGGGAGGTIILYGRDGVWVKTGRTVSANGGNGGAGSASGGAQTSYGAGGGGGGYVLIISPVYRNDGTVQASNGTKSANVANATGDSYGGGGGGHGGDGGDYATDGNAGQVITSTTTSGTYLAAALV